MLWNACQWCLQKTPSKFEPTSSTLPELPRRALASDERFLFDGEDLGQWKHRDPSVRPAVLKLDPVADTTAGGPEYGEARWKTREGVAIARPGFGDILTKESFGDTVYHLDFLLPEGEAKVNSGVFIDSKWEIQLVNSYGSDQLDKRRTCGAIYGVSAPSTNACGKPGTWQTLQVAVQHVDESTADLSVWLNGLQIHDRVRVTEPTFHSFDRADEEEEVEQHVVPWFASTVAQGVRCDMGKDFYGCGAIPHGGGGAALQ